MNMRNQKDKTREIRIATRGSRLALAQVEIVKRCIQGYCPQVTFREVLVQTKGDRDRTSPLSEIGGKGLFVKEVEQALLRNEADLAVHSGKDLPYELESSLMIGGVPEAADVRDVWILPRGKAVDPKTFSGTIGTGSARRIAEAKVLFPQASCEPIRGNVDTRLQELRDGGYDSLLLAKAGLDRLGLDVRDFDVIPMNPEEFLPSACQGIIAVECRKEDAFLQEVLRSITHEETERRFRVERCMLQALQADCTVPIGVYCQLHREETGGERMKLSVRFASHRIDVEAPYEQYPEVCRHIGAQLGTENF